MDVKAENILEGLDDKSDKSNVLEKNNTTPFTPSSDHEPATKKYVDENSSGGSGSGDWQGSVIDTEITTPPVSPSSGDRYLIGTSPSTAVEMTLNGMTNTDYSQNYSFVDDVYGSVNNTKSLITVNSGSGDNSARVNGLSSGSSWGRVEITDVSSISIADTINVGDVMEFVDYNGDVWRMEIASHGLNGSSTYDFIPASEPYVNGNLGAGGNTNTFSSFYDISSVSRDSIDASLYDDTLLEFDTTSIAGSLVNISSASGDSSGNLAGSFSGLTWGKLAISSISNIRLSIVPLIGDTVSFVDGNGDLWEFELDDILGGALGQSYMELEPSSEPRVNGITTGSNTLGNFVDRNSVNPSSMVMRIVSTALNDPSKHNVVSYDAGGSYYVSIYNNIHREWSVVTTSVNPSTFVNGTDINNSGNEILTSDSEEQLGRETPSSSDSKVSYSPAGDATGDWIGQDGNIAEWSGSEWVFTTPSSGMFVAKKIGLGVLYKFETDSWILFNERIQLDTFNPSNAIFPSSNPAEEHSRNNHPVISYDYVTDESAIFTSAMSKDYSNGDISVNVDWVSNETVGSVVWSVQFETNSEGGNNINSDSFASQQAIVSDTSSESGVIKRASIVFTNTQADDISAGDAYRLKVKRLATNVSDDMTDDAEIVMITLNKHEVS